jgi:hypothetical protein
MRRAVRGGRQRTGREVPDVRLRTTTHRALAVGLSAALTLAAAPAPAAPPPAAGGPSAHLVDPSEVARRLIDRAKTREERVKLFQDALGTGEVQKKARAMGQDPARLRAAVPHLTDRELAELSARAVQAKDVAAGHGGGSDGALILVGVLLLVAGIAVIVATADWYDDDYYYDDCWCY